MALYNLTSRNLSEASLEEVKPVKIEDLKNPKQNEGHIHNFLEKYGGEILLKDKNELLLIVGREIEGADLIALDRDGNLVVIELKRHESDKVIGQGLRYTATFNEKSGEEVKEIANSYLRDKKDREIEDIFQEAFYTQFPSSINSSQRLIIVMSYQFDESVRKAALYLREKGIDISCVEYTFFEKDNQRFISFNTIVGVERIRGSKQVISPSAEELLKIAKENGTIEIVKKLRTLKDLGLSEYPTLSGFSYTACARDSEGKDHWPTVISSTVSPKSCKKLGRGDVFIWVYCDEQHFAGYLKVPPEEIFKGIESFNPAPQLWKAGEQTKWIRIASEKEMNNFIDTIKMLINKNEK